MGPVVAADVLGMVPVANDPPNPVFQEIPLFFCAGFVRILAKPLVLQEAVTGPLPLTLFYLISRELLRQSSREQKPLYSVPGCLCSR